MRSSYGSSLGLLKERDDLNGNSTSRMRERPLNEVVNRADARLWRRSGRGQQVDPTRAQPAC